MQLKQRYQIEKLLSQGGMGKVYQARDLKIKRQVAIKQLWCPGVEDNSRLFERMRREYAFLSKINHDNVVKVFDLLEERGQLFLVMEFIAGVPLNTILAKPKPAQTNLCDQLAIACQIARGVEVLNTAGILHRDIKPSNIMLLPQQQQAKILDLGIGRSLTQDFAQLTRTGKAIGTPDYMSPEQVGGKFYENSDVFSLAVTLFQFFSWQSSSPFRGESPVATMCNIVTQPLSPLKQEVDEILQSAVSIYEDLSVMLAWGMEKEASRRAPSAKIIADRLHQIHQRIAESHTTSRWRPAEELESSLVVYLSGLGTEHGRDFTESLSGAQTPETSSSFANQIEKIGRYQIIRLIGRGGMGRVYLAKDPQLNREVALKTMLYSDDPGMRERFRREATAMARLSHPNIVKVYDCEKDGEIEYFTMEFIAGKNLRQYLQGERLTVRRVVEWTRKMAGAIDYAHRHGILHRDLKPANVMVNENGEPLVMDFGLAKDIASDGSLSQTGTALGTPMYMPPEQAQGKKREIDERSDVYSAGAILYELLTGVPPFQGDTTHAILLQVVEKEPIPPTQVSPKIPREMEAICLKAMAKDKNRRYQSAHELACDLQRFLNGEPVLASAPGWGYRLRKWVAKNRLLAAVLCAFFILASFSYFRNLAEKEKAIAAQRQAEKAQRQVMLAANELKNANQELAQNNDKLKQANRHVQMVSYLEKAERYWDEGKHREACLYYSYALEQADDPHWHRLVRLKLSARLPELFPYSTISIPGIYQAIRGDFIAFSPDSKILAIASGIGTIYLADAVTKKNIGKWKGHQAAVTHLVFSDDGHWLMSASDDQTIRVWETATGKMVMDIPHPKKINAAAFSPDGLWIASATERQVQLFSRTSKERIQLPQQTGAIMSMAFSPDCRMLAAGGRDDTVYLWDLKTKKKQVRVGFVDDVDSLAFSPDGKTIAAANGEVVTVWWIGTQKVFTLLCPTQVSCLAFHPNSNLLASGDVYGFVTLWNVETASVRTVTRPYGGSVRSVAFAKDGHSFASLHSDVEIYIHIWHLDPPSTIFRGWGQKTKKTFYENISAGHFRGVNSIAFSPDNKTLASAGLEGWILLWDVTKRRCKEILVNKYGEIEVMSRGSNNAWAISAKDVQHLQFSPDGAFLAVAARDRMVKLWDLQRRRMAYKLTGHSSDIAQIAFSPDGRLLASASTDGTAYVWQLPAKKVLQLRYPQGISSLAFTPDSTKIAFGSMQGGISIYDIAAANEVVKLSQPSGIKGILFVPPNGEILAAYSSAAVYLWDIAKNNQFKSFQQGHYWIHSAAVSPDGKTLAYGTFGRKVHLLDLQTAFSLDLDKDPRLSYHVLLGHSKQINDIVFSPDGRILATAGEEAFVILWDLARQKQLLDKSAGDLREQVQKMTGVRIRNGQAEPFLVPERTTVWR